MKKLFLSLVLVFALLTTSAVAAPEYVPGEISDALVNAAIDAGQIVGEAVNMELALNMEALGLDEETAAQVQLLLDFITAMHVTGAVGVTPDGPVLLCEVAYAPGGNRDFVSADAALTFGSDSVSLDSSVLPGKRLVVGYDELLSVAGVPDDKIPTILSALHGDEEAINACLSMLIDELYASLGIPEDFDWESAFEQAAGIVMPYVATIGEWANTLSVTIEENPQIEDYPAVDSRLVLSVAAADIANLIDALADQVQADEQLAPILNGIIASGLEEEEGDESVTVADICAAAKEIAAELREEEVAEIALIASIGMGENAGYFDLFDNIGMFNLHFLLAPAEEADTYAFEVTFAVADEFSLAASGTVYADPEDEMHVNVDMGYAVSASDGSTVVMSYAVAIEPSKTEEGMPAYSLTISENVQTTITEYDEEGNAQADTATVDVQGTGIMHKTENGEAAYVDMIANIDELGMPISISQYTTVEAVDGYLSGGEAISVAIPDLFELVLHSKLFSFDYDTASFAALEPIHVLTLSEEEIDALVNDILTNAQAKIEKAISIMPEGMTEMISELME